MKLSCLLGKHLKSRLTKLVNEGKMSVTYANGEKQEIKLPDIILEVCSFCHIVFYKD